MRSAKNLDLICVRYKEAIGSLAKLLAIPVRHPVNCMIGMMKTLKIPRKIGNQAVEIVHRTKTGRAVPQPMKSIMP